MCRLDLPILNSSQVHKSYEVMSAYECMGHPYCFLCRREISLFIWVISLSCIIIIVVTEVKLPIFVITYLQRKEYNSANVSFFWLLTSPENCFFGRPKFCSSLAILSLMC